MGRPIRRRYHRTPWAAAALLLALAVAGRFLLGCADHELQVDRGAKPGAASATVSIPAEGTYRVQRVVDGDTLVLENRAWVRLLGIDTPEIAHDGQPAEPLSAEAAEFTREFIGRSPVQLRLDHERVDKYRRWLAYVYVDGQMLNEALLRAGLAEVYRKARCSDLVKRRFQAAESEARQNRRGLWSR